MTRKYWFLIMLPIMNKTWKLIKKLSQQQHRYPNPQKTSKLRSTRKLSVKTPLKGRPSVLIHGDGRPTSVTIASL
jgi:hypothetical protein